MAVACATAMALPLRAEDAAVPQGYVFDRPELLADQLIWGIAHGARLLALACARAGKGEAAEAWVAWQERERAQILAANGRLGRHYFGREDAPTDAISAALGLASALALPPERLDPACASLAEALTQPRYDLDRRREELLAKVRDAEVAQGRETRPAKSHETGFAWHPEAAPETKAKP